MNQNPKEVYESFCIHDAIIEHIEKDSDGLVFYLNGEIWIKEAGKGKECHMQDIALRYFGCDSADISVYLTYRYGIRHVFYFRSERIVDFSTFMKNINDKKWKFEIIDDYYDHSCEQKGTLLIGAIYKGKKYIDARVEVRFEKMYFIENVKEFICESEHDQIRSKKYKAFE